MVAPVASARLAGSSAWRRTPSTQYAARLARASGKLHRALPVHEARELVLLRAARRSVTAAAAQRRASSPARRERSPARVRESRVDKLRPCAAAPRGRGTTAWTARTSGTRSGSRRSSPARCPANTALRRRAGPGTPCAWTCGAWLELLSRTAFCRAEELVLAPENALRLRARAGRRRRPRRRRSRSRPADAGALASAASLLSRPPTGARRAETARDEGAWGSANALLRPPPAALPVSLSVNAPLRVRPYLQQPSRDRAPPLRDPPVVQAELHVVEIHRVGHLRVPGHARARIPLARVENTGGLPRRRSSSETSSVAGPWYFFVVAPSGVPSPPLGRTPARELAQPSSRAPPPPRRGPSAREQIGDLNDKQPRCGPRGSTAARAGARGSTCSTSCAASLSAASSGSYTPPSC